MPRLYPRKPFQAIGGKLSRLPYSGTEASWVEQVFQKSGLEVNKLVRGSATEASVRTLLPGRQVLHFACHGLVDQNFGNLFGGLALAADRREGGSNFNDGLLTLAEIYNLDLDGCELAILSACETNIGPTQSGEGVWALARGFLVAGARRTVSSNWVVDDKAAASMMSYYCSLLARSYGEGRQPDYAQCLSAARRWVRGQDQWRSPYYWATFVHIGPN